MENRFENMPYDIIGNILSNMDIEDIGNVKSASKNMKKVLQMLKNISTMEM
jgi:hypothetical protein